MYLSAVHQTLRRGLLAGLLLAQPAIAQDGGVPSDPAIEEPSQLSKRAIALGHAGLKLMDLGEHERAFSAFQEAEQLVHSPVFLIYQARAAWFLGRYHVALALYRACSAENLDARSPELWRQTVADAEREQGRLREQMPLVELSFAGGVQLPLQLTIKREDKGATVDPTTSELSSTKSQLIQLDPGHYLITVSDGEKRVAERTLRIKSGSHVRVHFEFPTSKVQETTPAPLPSASPGTSALRAGAYAAWSSGGALLLGGAVAGGMAMALAQDVLRACSDNVCPAEEQGRVERAQRLGRLAAAGLVSGLIGEVAGTVLWLWDQRESRVRVATQGTTLTIEGKF